MARDEWGTPQSFFDLLDAEFGFEVDVCALSANAKCRKFYSPAEDGLKQTWTGICWMNPPYGRPIKDWMKKALDSADAGATVVCLVPTRTNAPWWHDYVMKASEIRFIRKKMSFTVPEGENWRDGVPFTGHAGIVFRPWRDDTTVSTQEQK